MRRLLVALLLFAGLGLFARAQPSPSVGPGTRPSPSDVSPPIGLGSTATNFELVGKDPLFNRGMNAAPAAFDHFLYVGSRTDGQPQHLHSGVLIVDIADPSNPHVVGEIGPPNEGNVGETSRELRVWPDKRVLIVMNFSCSAILHLCASGADAGIGSSSIQFYDLSSPAAPTLLTTFKPTRTPHEMFLWADPVASHAGRALLYYTTPNVGALQVLDLTDIRCGCAQPVRTILQWSGIGGSSTEDRRLHSLGLSRDGKRAYLAYLGSGFLVADTSRLADNTPDPVTRFTPTMITPQGNRLRCCQRSDSPNPGTHSAVKVPGTNHALVTVEVYGDSLDVVTGQNHGCPWGWAGLIGISDETTPTLAGEYKLDQNKAEYCSSLDGQDPANTTATSYSAHNPTVLTNLAFITWHSGGLQAVDISDRSSPVQAGVFLPDPLPAVVSEDPALSLGLSKVVMWSYPIIRNGLIYVIDVRNGLYVLRFTGPRRSDVDSITFLEGNSNLGDAAP